MSSREEIFPVNFLSSGDTQSEIFISKYGIAAFMYSLNVERDKDKGYLAM